MKNRWIPLAILSLVFGGAAVAADGQLTVKDNGKLFTPDGIKAAKDEFAKTKYDSATAITVVTFDGLPSKRKAEFDKAKDDKAARERFVGEWVRDEAKAEGAKGIFVLVATNPNQIRVIADEQMRVDRGFGEAKVGRMQELLIDAFKASKDLTGDVAKQGHDVGLKKAVDYAGEQLKGTAAKTKSSAKHANHTSDASHEIGGKAMGSGILGWVCLIGVVLLGVWLVVGVVRALAGGFGGGGMGGPGMMGGGYGGGGGGFMSSLLGGMFGSMAGMWMYNNFFGGGMSSMSAGDYGGGGYGNDAGGYGGDAGGEAGNFDNGADAGGGDWGDTGGGGGDYAGGDFGGGDFGGGGGDFGGGGGDW
jgi:uncharacterized protein